MRKAGELLEDALGLGGPGSPRRSAQAAQAAGTTAAGPPEWASSEHYPGQPSSAPRVYPDDSKQVAAADAYGFGAAPPAHAATGAGGEQGKHHLDFSKLSPRAQAIAKEVGHELEEAPSVIT